MKLYKNISTTVNQLGLKLEDITSVEAKRRNIKQGVKISNINNKKLEYLGLKKGQIILSINGREINNVDDVNNSMNSIKTGDKLLLEVLTEKGQKERYIFN